MMHHKFYAFDFILSFCNISIYKFYYYMMLCSIDASRTTLKATTYALQGQRKYMGAEKTYTYVEK